MPRTYPEKSTNQLAVWLDLVEALDQVEAAWEASRSATPRTPGSVELPANVAVALVKAARRGTHAMVGVADVLVEQRDSGGAFREVASALRQAVDKWPTR